MGGTFAPKRIDLDPTKNPGKQTYRFCSEGWGQISVHLQVNESTNALGSWVSANTEVQSPEVGSPYAAPRPSERLGLERCCPAPSSAQISAAERNADLIAGLQDPSRNAMPPSVDFFAVQPSQLVGSERSNLAKVKTKTARLHEQASR